MSNYILVGLVHMLLFLGLPLQLAYGQSLLENLSSGNSSTISNSTGESLAEKVVDPESLMLGILDQTGGNNTLGRMVGECGIIKPSSGMEESEELAECQERIINETD